MEHKKLTDEEAVNRPLRKHVKKWEPINEEGDGLGVGRYTQSAEDKVEFRSLENMVGYDHLGYAVVFMALADGCTDDWIKELIVGYGLDIDPSLVGRKGKRAKCVMFNDNKYVTGDFLGKNGANYGRQVSKFLKNSSLLGRL